MFKLHLIAAIVLLQCLMGVPASAGASQFESGTWSTPANVVDVRVEAALRQHGVDFRPPCSDEVFLRRVYIDLTGTLPTSQEAIAFLRDANPNKRAALIDSLFDRPEYSDYWALKWCDLLRVKSEFPSNLWPNAVQAYHRWIRDCIRQNRPYNQFARDLLTSSGSNFRVPQVNFYRAVPARDPATIARIVAITFMGARIERWPKSRLAGMAAFFSRIAYKKTGEWKEEIILLDPAPAAPLKAVLPDGTAVTVPSDEDPREAFAGWLLSPKNPWFARCAVNRIWAWIMGRGIIHEPDDIRPDNPPASQSVLACLENELIHSRYNLRHVYRLILNSRTYQQSSIPHGAAENSAVQFARYAVRRLDAEVLIDALCRLDGDGESYSSAIPEPFTYIPNNQRTIALADGSISSRFLITFGRPARDTGLESERDNRPTDTQSLYLLNSTEVQRRIQRSPGLRSTVRLVRSDPEAAVRDIYLTVLARYPTPGESAAVQQYFKTEGMPPGQVVADTAWALINTKEFLYRH